MPVNWAGFHVMRLGSGSMGVLFVVADWRVRVFGSSSLVDIPSDHLYVRSIPLYGCMYRRYYYIWDICN